MEKAATPTPQAIERANRHDVRIRWNDGHESLYVARDLRLECPCAACVDEVTGRPRLDPATVPLGVHPLSIAVVGRYAISIDWSDGHCTGIYTFRQLRETCPCPKCHGDEKPEAGGLAPPQLSEGGTR